MPGDEAIHCSPVEWLPGTVWSRGRVVLIGDAAHAMSPMMGQGGCMAMEDACVLAEELRAAASVESALASFVARRRPRVEWVQRQSMALGLGKELFAQPLHAAARHDCAPTQDTGSPTLAIHPLVQAKTGTAIGPMPTLRLLTRRSFSCALTPIVPFADIPSIQLNHQGERPFGQP